MRRRTGHGSWKWLPFIVFAAKSRTQQRLQPRVRGAHDPAQLALRMQVWGFKRKICHLRALTAGRYRMRLKRQMALQPSQRVRLAVWARTDRCGCKIACTSINRWCCNSKFCLDWCQTTPLMRGQGHCTARTLHSNLSQCAYCAM